MSKDDRQRWDERHRTARVQADAPHGLMLRAARWMPGEGRAVDLAGGRGQNACILARRGLETTLCDISGEALGHARRLAEQRGLDLHLTQLDLETQLPAGPFAVVSCINYLDRAMLQDLPDILAPGGLIVLAVATRINLERHERPSARWLLLPGEAPSLFVDMDLLLHEEMWRENGRHEAWVVAQKR